MKHITLLTAVILYSCIAFSQINNDAQRKETINWLNERLKEAAPAAKTEGVISSYRMSNFDECLYLIRTKIYVDQNGKKNFGSNVKTTFSFADCKQELMLKFVKEGKLWFNIGVDANDNSIQQFRMDENNKGISTSRLTSIDIGPFNNTPALSEKIKNAIQSLTTYCKKETGNASINKSDNNRKTIIEWLNNKIALARKVPINVNQREIINESTASLFENCTYIMYSDLWEFTADSIGSIGITKQIVETNELDASTITNYNEDGKAWFLVMTKGQKKSIPVYRCGKDRQVTRLETYTTPLRLGHSLMIKAQRLLHKGILPYW
jgi:hypothetical protein